MNQYIFPITLPYLFHSTYRFYGEMDNYWQTQVEEDLPIPPVGRYRTALHPNKWFAVLPVLPYHKCGHSVNLRYPTLRPIRLFDFDQYQKDHHSAELLGDLLQRLGPIDADGLFMMADMIEVMLFDPAQVLSPFCQPMKMVLNDLGQEFTLPYLLSGRDKGWNWVEAPPIEIDWSVQTALDRQSGPTAEWIAKVTHREVQK